MAFKVRGGLRRVGIAFQTIQRVWLRAAMLTLGTLVLPALAHAADVQATDDDTAAAETAGQPQKVKEISADKFADYRIERLGKDGIKLASTGQLNSYAVTLLGSDSNAESDHTVLPAGEAWQRSLGVEVEGKLGNVLETSLQTHFTQAQRTLSQELFGLQPLDSAGNNQRALGEFSVSTKFLGDRIGISSTRRQSSLSPFAEAETSKGTSEQDQFNASILRWGHDGLSVDGSLSRMDADYQDLVSVNPGDILQKRNKETRQLRSKLNVDRVGLFVTERNISAIVPDRPGASPAQAEIETGINVRLSDLRNAGSESFVAPVLAVLPDTIWISTDHGSIEPASENASFSALEKSAFGLTRNWNAAALNLSYWQSTVQTRPGFATDALWRAHGMDVAGNFYSGPWSVSGNLSWYRADNVAEWNNSAEGSINASLFLAWHPRQGPKVSAGLTNYAYQADFFDYNGMEQSSLFRYQVAVDMAPLLATTLRDSATQLTFLASFQGDSTRSQWSQAGYVGQEGNVFFGLKFAQPFLY